MQNAATANWRDTTKGLIERLAKERKIAPADVMVLMRFVVAGEAQLRKEESEVPALEATG